MKYYRIEQDDKVQHLPQMVNWFNVINEKYLHKGNYHMIADKTMIYIKHDEQVVFPDAMIYPFHGFTEPIKKKIALYEPNMGFKTVFLVDKSNKNFQRYFIPFLSEYDYQADYVVKLSEKKKQEEREKAAKGENVPESLVTWIFQDDFIPRAKITKDGVYSIMTDYLGTPVEVRKRGTFKVHGKNTMYEYDRQGNTLSDSENTYRYDRLNRIVEVQTKRTLTLFKQDLAFTAKYVKKSSAIR